MSEITKIPHAELPVALPDLSKFIVFNREKLVSIRAEIRALRHLDIAKDVLEQKHQEGRELAEAILDAEVQVGRLTQQMEKGAGRPTKIRNTVVMNYTDSSKGPLPHNNVVMKSQFVPHAENERADNVSQESSPLPNITPFPTKQQKLAESGLTPMQASRYEAMAKHPEIVEQAKAEARETGRMVTQKAVLDLIKAKEVQPNPYEQIDADYVLSDRLNKAVTAVNALPCDPRSISSIQRALDISIINPDPGDEDVLLITTLDNLSQAIGTLTRIYNALKGAKR